MKGILARKIGMTRIFAEDGKAIPVTVLEATDTVVTKIKTEDSDGYDAIQLGIGKKKLTKPMAGALNRKKTGPAILQEIRGANADANVRMKVSVDQFHPGDKVNLSGISKGKGFAGVIKRHGFHGGPASHGSDHHRAPGSIGSMFPQRVLRGKKMPGHMGQEKKTLHDVEVVAVHPDRDVLLLKGPVPGPVKGIICLWKE